MNQVTKVTNDPKDPPKIINSSRDCLTKSPKWRMIQEILQIWSIQIEIVKPSHQGYERSKWSSKDDWLK